MAAAAADDGRREGGLFGLLGTFPVFGMERTSMEETEESRGAKEAALETVSGVVCPRRNYFRGRSRD